MPHLAVGIVEHVVAVQPVHRNAFDFLDLVELDGFARVLGAAQHVHIETARALPLGYVEQI